MVVLDVKEIVFNFRDDSLAKELPPCVSLQKETGGMYD